MTNTQKIIVALIVIACSLLGYYGGKEFTEREYKPQVENLTSELSDRDKKLAIVKDQASYNEGLLADSQATVVKLENDRKAQQKNYEDSLSTIRKYTDSDAERAIARHYARQKR